jgi:S-adenosylmethionine hydrolase
VGKLHAAYSSFPKGTVHLIGVDMELNKENQHIVMQWNDSYFIAADNGILSMLSKKLFLKEWLLLYPRSCPAKRLALMFCFSGLSYRKGWITKRHWKEKIIV